MTPPRRTKPDTLSTLQRIAKTHTNQQPPTEQIEGSARALDQEITALQGFANAIAARYHVQPCDIAAELAKRVGPPKKGTAR